jgi:hypothetical protein
MGAATARRQKVGTTKRLRISIMEEHPLRMVRKASEPFRTVLLRNNVAPLVERAFFLFLKCFFRDMNFIS